MTKPKTPKARAAKKAAVAKKPDPIDELQKLHGNALGRIRKLERGQREFARGVSALCAALKPRLDTPGNEAADALIAVAEEFAK